MKLSRILAVVIALGLLAGYGAAQELVTLSTPQIATATTCTATYVALDLANASIVAQVTYNTGKLSTVVYGPAGITVDGAKGAATPTGATLLSALNTSNNSAGTSLIKRVYARLNADGICVGAVTGSPQ